MFGPSSVPIIRWLLFKCRFAIFLLFSAQRIWSRKDNIPRIMFRSKARRRINNIRISEGKRRARFYRLMQLNGPAWSRFWHRRQLDLFDQSLFIIRE